MYFFAFFLFHFLQALPESHEPSLSHFLDLSKQALGAPYQFDPIGDPEEGPYRQPAQGPRPLHPKHAHDCVTFVLEVLSQLYGRDEAEIEHNRRVLRYAQAPYHWFNRNHFMETDGLKALQHYLHPHEPPAHTRVIKQAHRASAWWQSKKDQHPPGTLNPQQAALFQTRIHAIYPSEIRLRYWPWSALMSSTNLRSPSELLDPHHQWAVVLFVRKNWPSQGPTPILISHIGFLWNHHGCIMLRHASLKQGVMDIPLKAYLEDKIPNPSWIGLVILHPKAMEHKSSPT